MAFQSSFQMAEHNRNHEEHQDLITRPIEKSTMKRREPLCLSCLTFLPPQLSKKKHPSMNHYGSLFGGGGISRGVILNQALVSCQPLRNKAIKNSLCAKWKKKRRSDQSLGEFTTRFPI